MRSNIIDIDVEVVTRTAKAVLVHTGDEGKAVWLPLSQVEIEPHENMQRVYVLSLPEPLAIEKELV